MMQDLNDARLGEASELCQSFVTYFR